MFRQALAALTMAVSTYTFAQQISTQIQKPTPKELTVENIYDPKHRVIFAALSQKGFVWLDDKTFTWPRTDEKGDVVEQSVMDTETGRTRLLFDPSRLQAAARKIGGMTEDDLKALVTRRNWTFNPAKSSVILSLAGDLYLYTLDSDSMLRLTSAPGDEEEASFSPDGRYVAFVRHYNLYVVDVATRRERQLTTDGADDILNGIFDWVYQEEIYGRGNFHAYWWSPDSSRLAFIRLDERMVKRFAVVDHIPTMQDVEPELYPKAGYPNPVAKLFTVAAADGAPREVTTGNYAGEEFLIVSVAWAPDSGHLLYQIQNREQTWLDLNTSDGRGNRPKTLLRETTKAWVEPSGDPKWLADGSFLWLSERDGFKHLYRYSGDGTLQRRITGGPWEVRVLHGVDAANEWIYFSGTERAVVGTDVYRIHPDGTGMQRLSEAAGTHAAIFNPAMTQYIDSWSDFETPAQIHLHRADGTRIRTIDRNQSPLLRELHLARPQFLQVKTRDGFVMEAVLIKPPDFDASRKYPVYQFTYSGPHAQSVRNEWSSRAYLWYQLLASQGIVVWICDNRSASGKGAQSAWPIYKKLGELELRDLEDGVKWLTSQPYIDASRVMLEGWSFGGFMTTYALTHSTMWSAGMAGASVSDWRDYDSIYTERYMLRPHHNEEGYKAASPRWSAKDLHGNLLLLHGTNDENVHLQNTIQFVYELEKAGKQFQMLLYAKSRHGVTDPVLVAHMRAAMFRFVMENFGPQ